MIEEKATVRITEAELARDVHAVLAKVQEGVEVVVEQDHRTVAIIKKPQGPGRRISECATDFHREPMDPPAWE